MIWYGRVWSGKVRCGTVSDRMITKIELAKSGRSKCIICKKGLIKGNPRGVSSLGFICHRCFIDKNKNDIKLLRELNKEFKKVVKSKSRELMLQTLKGENKHSSLI